MSEPDVVEPPLLDEPEPELPPLVEPAPTPVPSSRTWLPTPTTIAALMHARFGVAGLTTTSQPTLEQVGALITMLADSTVAQTDEPEIEQHALARTTVALGVASYIESSAYPEQTDLTDSPAMFYRLRYGEHLAALRRAIVTAHRPYSITYVPVFTPRS